MKDKIMNESVKKWLNDLNNDPIVEIEKLIMGYTGVSAWSKSSLRECVLEIFQTHSEVLDNSIATWLQEMLDNKLIPDKTPTTVWASNIQDLFAAIVGLNLPKVASLMYNRSQDFRLWLHPMKYNENLDPESAFLSTLTWFTVNRRMQ